MKSLCACLLALTAAAHAADASKKIEITGEGHRLFCADYDKAVMAIVKADGTIEWSKHMDGGAHDAWILANGNILWTPSGNQVYELDPKTNMTVWSYDAGKKNGNDGREVQVHGIQPQADGSVVVFESGPGRAIEVDRDGKLLKEVHFTIKETNPHHQMRNARKLSNGHYLVCQDGDGKVIEYDDMGKNLWEFDTPGAQPYSAIRLTDGNTLINDGNGHKIIEVDKDAKVVWSIGEKELPGITIAWGTQIQRLPNGNTVFINCHAGPENPQFIEVDKDKKVVWSFRDREHFGNNMAVGFVLDAPGAIR